LHRRVVVPVGVWGFHHLRSDGPAGWYAYGVSPPATCEKRAAAGGPGGSCGGFCTTVSGSSCISWCCTCCLLQFYYVYTTAVVSTVKSFTFGAGTLPVMHSSAVWVVGRLHVCIIGIYYIILETAAAKGDHNVGKSSH
jgi:hypothetical protein